MRRGAHKETLTLAPCCVTTGTLLLGCTLTGTPAERPRLCCLTVSSCPRVDSRHDSAESLATSASRKMSVPGQGAVVDHDLPQQGAERVAETTRCPGVSEHPSGRRALDLCVAPTGSSRGEVFGEGQRSVSGRTCRQLSGLQVSSLSGSLLERDTGRLRAWSGTTGLLSDTSRGSRLRGRGGGAVALSMSESLSQKAASSEARQFSFPRFRMVLNSLSQRKGLSCCGRQPGRKVTISLGKSASQAQHLGSMHAQSLGTSVKLGSPLGDTAPMAADGASFPEMDQRRQRKKPSWDMCSPGIGMA